MLTQNPKSQRKHSQLPNCCIPHAAGRRPSFIGASLLRHQHKGAPQQVGKGARQLFPPAGTRCRACICDMARKKAMSAVGTRHICKHMQSPQATPFCLTDGPSSQPARWLSERDRLYRGRGCTSRQHPGRMGQQQMEASSRIHHLSGHG